MKSITQKHSFGCGIACVAFISHKNYNRALKLFINGSKKAGTSGFICKDIVLALNKAGLDYKYKFVKGPIKQTIYRNGTIVFIKRCKTYPAGHYLARKNNCWMDPWINFLKNKNMQLAKSGFRKRLPGRPIYAILPN